MAAIPVKEVARGKVRPSQTDYRVLEKFKDTALIEATLRTGRTHQIRLHMRYLGHPILGDDIYGTKTSKRLSKTLGVARQMLHAKILGLPHPRTGEWMEYEAPLPDDFMVCIDCLRAER